MLNEKMIRELDVIAASISNVEDIEIFSYMSCDCTNGCTDGCYDCAGNSGNQW